MPSWQCFSFLDRSNQDLYEILRARQIVFVVEQNCAYLDADDLERECLHLLGWEGEGKERELVAYCRILPPGLKFQEPSIGRVITMPGWRGRGLGKELMKQSIAKRLGPPALRAVSRMLFQRPYGVNYR